MRAGVFAKMMVLILVVGIIGGLSAFINFRKLNHLDQITHAVNELRQLGEAMEKAISAINTINLAAMDAIVDRDSGTVSSEVVDDYEDSSKQLQNLLGPVSRAFALAKVDSQFLDYQSQTKSLVSATESLFDLVRAKSKNEKAFADYDDQIDLAAVSSKKIIREVLEILSADIDAKTKAFNEESSSTRIWLILSSLLVIVVMAGIGIPIAIQITRPLKEVTTSITSSTETLSEVKTDIVNSQSDLKSVVEQQTAAVHQTTAAMQETKRSLERGLEFLSDSVRVAKDSRDKSQTGEQVMTTLLQSMTDLKKSSLSLEKMIQILTEIAKKAEFINGIVFKTQMLSVNASIEAARAGQFGKGFSVVAEEVGSLANLSGDSAKQINLLIQNGIRSANELVADIAHRIESTFENNRQAQEVFREIAADMVKVSDRLDSLEKAQAEQNAAVAETLQAMGSINSGSIKCSEVSDRFISLTESLTTQVTRLESDVVRTQTVVSGRVAA